MTDDIYETPSTTPNFQTELAAQLAELIPEAIADGKVDVEKLKELLDGDAADGSERFGLFWPGKKRALRAAQEPTTATLKPDIENSKDWGTTKNIFIEGDNLEVLKILQKYFHAKVKMIYIDPPYNTGKDFVYPDNYKEGLDTYLEWTRQVNEEGKKVSTNAETEGRYHSNWLNMMYPRLKLARNLLTDDGVIFISIDDIEIAQLRKICDEIFGETNFVTELVWQSTAGSNTGTDIVTVTEYVLVYTKNRNFFVFDGMPSNEQSYSLSDSHEKERGKYALDKLDRRRVAGHYSEALDYPIEMPDGTLRYPGGGSEKSTEGWNYLWSKTKIEWGIANGFIEFKNTNGEWNVYNKRYSKVDNGGNPVERTTPYRNLITSDQCNTAQGTSELRVLFEFRPFDFPKPSSLIKHLLNTAIRSDRETVFLDFFAGSSTSAHALMQLNAEDGGNRKFIMVQLPEPTPQDSEARKAGFGTIADISRERIRRAGEKIKADNPLTTTDLDTGFRAYKLSDTNFTKWRVSSDVESDALQQHLLDLRESSSADAATSDDLLTEILLKQGYSLTEKITPRNIAGLELRAVGDNIVLAYLNEHIKPTLEQLRAVVDEEPARIIVLEDAFQGDDELKTNLSQLAKSKGIELWTA